MDDLDHSMHIAEHDWVFFCEESEECDLEQVSLACLDNSDLSEPEDFESLSSALRSPTRDNTAEERCSELFLEFTLGGQQNDVATEGEESSLSNRDSKNEVAKGSDTNKVHAEVIVDATGLVKQPEHDTCSVPSTQELSPSANHVSEWHETDGAVSQNVGATGGPGKAERERWFVTVNDSPAPTRLRGASMKKKRRLKKPRRDILRWTLEQEKQGWNETTEEKSEGSHTPCQGSGWDQSIELNPESFHTERVSDSPSKEEMLDCPKDGNAEPPQETNANQTTTLKATSEPECVESEFEDSAEWVSIRSCESEAYLSAVESEADLARVDFQLEKRLFGCFSNSCEQDANPERDAGASSGVLAHSAAADCEGYESPGDQTYARPAVTLPTTDDSSTCDSNVHIGQHMPSDASAPQKPAESDPPVTTWGDERATPSPPVPDTTAATCFPADNPEMYAEAEGQPRPVFAISAFWDEMEKLTINDILQLRMARSPPHKEPADVPDNGGSLVDTEEFHSHDAGVMDTSDTADSDYFTQPDDSKPDRSSCDFSTSDFEEEYWQFNGQRMSESPFSAREEEDSTCSEGKETPVPLDEFPGEYLDNRGSRVLLSGEWPRRMTKSKSLHNVRALKEHLPVRPCPGDEEQLCMEEDALEDSLLSLIPAPILLDDCYQISFPEVFEYFFTQDTAKAECNCVTVYDPEKISVTPVYGYACTYTRCTFEDDVLITSQRGEGRPIPIFSYSHPTVRELTFPEPDYVFLSPDPSEADSISPIRLVSHSLIQGKNGGSDTWNWKSLFSLRKVRFHGKGSLWCGGSGVWVFPAEVAGRTKAHVPVLSAGRVSSVPSQMFGEMAVQEKIWGMGRTTSKEPDGIFSTLKQSDMCLVCIAFAAWVLTSSDPDAADAWKAALLANVSALSAIQYLRHYVKKKKNLSW